MGLTVLTTVLLKMAGMNWFDSLCHAMSACATSGFSTKNASIAYFNSPMIDTDPDLRHGYGGYPLRLIYATVTGKRNNIFRSEVTLVPVMLLGGGLLIAVSPSPPTYTPAVFGRVPSCAFPVRVACHDDGFATADSNQWTSFAVILLIFGSIVCLRGFHRGRHQDQPAGAGDEDDAHAPAPAAAPPTRSSASSLTGSFFQENEALHSVMIFIVAYLMLIPRRHGAGDDVRRRSDDQLSPARWLRSANVGPDSAKSGRWIIFRPCRAFSRYPVRC